LFLSVGQVIILLNNIMHFFKMSLILYILKCYLCYGKAEFSASLLQFSVSHDLSNMTF